jgi:fumarate hydratase class I
VAIEIAFPADEAAIRALHAGDEVLVSGTVLTAREPAHRMLVRLRAGAWAGGLGGPSFLRPPQQDWARGAALYHCGPVVVRGEATGEWRFAAAGPSDSLREEPWTAEVIARYGIRGIIGRGGMGPSTGAALARCGAVYLHATGALAVTLARHVMRVASVHLLDELGLVEAIWRVEVDRFPATVTMDAHGVSLHARRAGESDGGDPPR